MSKNTPLNDEQIGAAVKAYQAGASCRIVGEMFDRSEKAISALMHRQGVSRGVYTSSRHADLEFIALRESGKTSVEIAAHFGVKSKTVEWWIVRAIRAGLVGKAAPGAKVWDEAAVTRLKSLWETMGPAEISRETGWNPSQIIGKARRLGLPAKRLPVARKKSASREDNEVQRLAAEAARIERTARQQESARLRRQEHDRLWQATPESRPFLSAGKNDCRWPLDGEDGVRACCRPVENGDTYCPPHRLLAGGGRVAPIIPRGYGASTGRPSVVRGVAA